MAMLKVARRSMIIYFKKGRMNGYLRRYGVITYINRKQKYLVLSYNDKYEKKIVQFLGLHKDCDGYEHSLFNYDDFDMNIEVKAID